MPHEYQFNRQIFARPRFALFLCHFLIIGPR
jgi:hypothetical protein